MEHHHRTRQHIVVEVVRVVVAKTIGAKDFVAARLWSWRCQTVLEEFFGPQKEKGPGNSSVRTSVIAKIFGALNG